MHGKIYDQNMLRVEKADNDFVDWYEVTSDNFDIYGLVPENDGVLTRRIPLEIAEKVSPGVSGQSGYGAGGRIVFLTNSPFVALRIEYGAVLYQRCVIIVFHMDLTYINFVMKKMFLLVHTDLPAILIFVLRNLRCKPEMMVRQFAIL